MFQKSSKKLLLRTALIVVIIVLMPLTVVFAAQTGDSRDTGSTVVNTDGSTTVFPIIEVAAQQFPAAYPGDEVGIDANNGTGSGHGRMALLSQVPINSGNGGPNQPIDVALASSACSDGSDAFNVTNTNFTEGTLTKGTASSLKCADLSFVQIAKDAITILVNQNKATCIANTTTGPTPKYISSNEIIAIWAGQTYVSETAAPTGTGGSVQHAWNEFWPGCGGENIVPVSRIALPTSSGTRSAFLDFTGISHDSGNEELEQAATGVGRFSTNPQVETDISNNASHMGYTGMIFDNTKTAQVPLGLSSNYNRMGIVGPKAAAAPSYSHVADSSYPFNRPLYYYYKTNGAKQATIDLGNWLLQSAMQGNIKKMGFVAVHDASNPSMAGSAPAVDWDVNVDGAGDIRDVTSIGGYFGQTAPASGDPNYPIVRGWVRGDVNFDGTVNIIDITTFGSHFGTCAVAGTYPSCSAY